ncbi:Pirin-like protein [Wickerhamomyces ciferrii]|uniref:Pirin-like protein n=1 Tax=Wickerhamomyces ciferrii (strain ATCC 14091 / BCRC 22168 / CBS 111 / JCM 3599 / NBRC 0793 / NRRL Y-1031 F-60-10) TaxID=1206466 RepID=K0KU22_WICCF|nr:Pirin-like protein [Wickerhamomyces ciferrii]CCH44909.1 Pirin-like protein [Wickerhamomyces ciferrii]
MSDNMVSPRSILKYFLAVAQEEGVGAKVRRSIGTYQIRNFTPFLMLDHFNVSPPAGFPDHPHHGQETITYMLTGRFAHEDFTGSRGVLNSGDLQFMTAGKGIVHSEIPIGCDDGTPATGMQLWVDLPKKLKNCDPRYRDLRKDEIPIVKPNDKVTVKVISGKSYGKESLKELAYTPVHYYDYEVAPGGEFTQEFPKDFNVFLYVLKGGLEINGEKIEQYNAVFFNTDGDSVQGKVPQDAKESTQFVVVGGQKLEQPIVQHGPFVETSREKIYEVFMNYQAGANGFENAPGFKSSISDGVNEKDLIDGDLAPIKGKKIPNHDEL